MLFFSARKGDYIEKKNNHIFNNGVDRHIFGHNLKLDCECR